MSRRKKSSSCENISSLISLYKDYDQSYYTHRKSMTLFSPQRLLKPKSPLVRSNSLHANTGKNASSSDIASNIDCRLIQIKKQLAMFRQQDTDFRERMDSLSNSIEDLTPSTCSLTSQSEVSDIMTSTDYASEEQHYKDDQTIENEIKNVSLSFSSEVLNRIPSIAVTCYKTRHASDPELAIKDFNLKY